MTQRILIVEDERAIRDMIAFALRRAGMEAIPTEDALAAQHAIGEKLPDLILLDWMLPGMSGLEYARRLKREELTREIPVIMLTARGEEDDRVIGLDTGVDDYVVKPFSTRELIARIKAVLRRANPGADGQVVKQGDLVLDTAAHRAFVGTHSIALGPTEYRLLSFFISHPERVYSRSQLLDHVWGSNVYVEERTVDVHIRRLRKSLEPFAVDKYIQTVRGAGYRFSTIE
jgi:two-component system, OmpR family, phosphate regulon response regulator PhoB